MIWNDYLGARVGGRWLRLTRSKAAGPLGPSSRSAANSDDAKQAWFFVKASLERPSWDNLRTVLGLYADLTGERIVVTGHGQDSLLVGRVLEVLDRALAMGTLHFEEVPREPILGGEAQPAPPPEPPRTSRTQKQSEAIYRYTVTVIDHTGKPVDNASILLEIEGQPQRKSTGAQGRPGVAEFSWPSREPANLSLTNIDVLRNQLKPTWKKPAADGPAGGGGTVIKVPIVEEFKALKVAAESCSTIVLAPPYFHCAEISGTHFDFGRSFVKSGSFEQLAKIAESIHDNDDRHALIVGHTDLSGSQALNKELSERRAQAVHALLTHDAAAWEELFSGSADRPQWKEKWDILEAQHMLNALRVVDDAGHQVVENGVRNAQTKQAIHRFQRSDYPDVPAEQAPLAQSDYLGPEGRRELFLAYAKRISRKPVPPDRFLSVGGSPFTGCGEFNPLSMSAKDAESRRVVVFVFDPLLTPNGLPCQKRSILPCKQRCSDPPDDASVPPYRCCAYRELAAECPAAPGPDLSHDLILRFPVDLAQANRFSHAYVLESEDGTVHIEKTLRDDARSNDDGRAELYFHDLPETHSYRLQCRDEAALYTVFDYLPLEDLIRFARGAATASETTELASAFEPDPGMPVDSSAGGDAEASSEVATV